LQTQVFVGGRCVGTRAMSYADASAQPGFSDEQMHGLLKAQHRSVLDAIREDRLEAVMGGQGAVQDTEGEGLGLELLGATRHPRDGFRIRFAVRDDGAPAVGARVSVRLADADSNIVAEGSTNHEGVAEVPVSFDADSLQESGILVQTTFQAKSATRKFRLRRS
jgi:hypothetical protein